MRLTHVLIMTLVLGAFTQISLAKEPPHIKSMMGQDPLGAVKQAKNGL